MKKLIYFLSVFMVYFGAGFLTLWLMLRDFNIDLDYEPQTNAEMFRDAAIFFAPFIAMLLGEAAAFLIGSKLFEKWKLKEAFITLAVSAAGFISAAAAAVMII